MKKIGLIIGVLVLLGGVGVYFLKPDLLSGSKSSKAKEKEKEEEVESTHEVGADLDVFVVNLAGSGTSRYLRTTLSLGVKDEHDKEKVKELSGKIRHAVIMYLTERKVEELTDPEGKNKLRDELKKQIGEAIESKKLVTNVYFKEFLIQ